MMSLDTQDVQECEGCGEEVGSPLFPVLRAELGYVLCLPCGELASKAERKLWCVAPMHKSNYMKINNRADLLGINNKGGLVK